MVRWIRGGVVALLASCGTPWSEAQFGYRCFPEEVGETRCADGVELRCELFEPRWPDYHLWLLTGEICGIQTIGPVDIKTPSL